MRLFIDSANPDDWSNAAARGLVYGVTTNPLVFDKAGARMNFSTCCQLMDRARELELAELQFQLFGLHDPAQSAQRFLALFEKWPEGLVAKVPLTEQGLDCLAHLPAEVPITFTAAYTPAQAVIGAAKNARYIAPYYGRLLEGGKPADEILRDMKQICASAQTRVLVASIRSAEQVAQLAAAGQDTFTLTPPILNQLLDEPLSIAATEAFEAAATKGL